MKICFNAQALTHSHFSGIGVYAYHLIKNIIELDHQNHYYLLSSKPLARSLKAKNLYTKQAQSSFGFSYLQYSRTFNEIEGDLAFIPKESAPLFIKKPIIVVVFDLFFLKCPRHIKKQISLSSRLHYLQASLYSLKKADKIICISEDCKKDVTELCGIAENKVEAIALGYDETIFFPRLAEKCLSTKNKYGIHSPFFINISSVWWERKNLLNLLNSFYQFWTKNRDYSLVILGQKGPSFEQMQEFITKHHLQKNVFLLEQVPLDDMAALLSCASALVFPSYHEGFGLPILEAMACGCPVITSHCSAMPEVAGQSALLVNPHSCDSIAAAMHQIIDSSLNQQLKQSGLIRAKTFSWQKCAQETLRLINFFN